MWQYRVHELYVAQSVGIVARFNVKSTVDVADVLHCELCIDYQLIEESEQV
jgi:hypothetical protein